VAPPPADDATLRRRAEIGPGGLRGRVARGTIVNTVYLVAVNGLTIVQGLLMARVLGAREYGLWALLAMSFGTLFALAAVGLDDKYLQQDHPDQRKAFEIAFTLQSMLCGLFTLIAIAAIPLFAALYDEPRIVVPGLILAVALPLIALQTPMWVFYRRMDFVKQRALESINPVVAFVVSVVLAIAGFGFWSLIIGTLAGSLAAATAAVVASPYKLRFRYERGAMREYATFSWPLLFGSASSVVAYQIPVTLAARLFGSASVGAITLSSQITQYTKRVDDIVTHALYPAICVVKDQRDLLFESFTKSNALALLWGFPTGIAAALFADQAVHLVLGDSWHLAVPLIQVLGVSAAVDQIGFNWTALARARGETRVLGIGSAASLVAMVGVGVPLLIAHGLPGFAIGIGAGTLATLIVRTIYLVRLFPAQAILRHVGRAIMPTAAGAAFVLILRAAAPGGSSLRAVAEAGVYLLLVAGVTWFAEGKLLRESVGYLIRARKTRPAA
jgi:O-antigen/teichoic acid export membrane protein